MQCLRTLSKPLYWQLSPRRPPHQSTATSSWRYSDARILVTEVAVNLLRRSLSFVQRILKAIHTGLLSRTPAAREASSIGVKLRRTTIWCPTRSTRDSAGPRIDAHAWRSTTEPSRVEALQQ